jgi:hypothetical protein
MGRFRPRLPGALVFMGIHPPVILRMTILRLSKYEIGREG